jgi:hypothetical protein
MSAGAHPIYFGPIGLSGMQKCILLLVLRFLWRRRRKKLTRYIQEKFVCVQRKDFFTGEDRGDSREQRLS